MLTRIKIFFSGHTSVQNGVSILILSVAILVALLPLFWGTVIHEDDVAYYYLPAFKFYSDAIHAGENFIITPQVFSGFPISLSQVGGFYEPLNLFIFKYLPFLTAYHARIALNYVLAALFMFLFARSLKLGFVASLIGAFAYITAQNIVPGSNILRSNSFFLMPGLFFAVYSLYATLEDRKIVQPFFYIGVGSLIFSLSFLGGYTQLNLYGLVAVGFFSIYLLFTRFSWSFFLSLVSMFSVGSLLFLTHVLNVIQLIPGSFRESGLATDAALASVSLMHYIVTLTVFLFLPSFSLGTLQSLYIGSLSVFFFFLSLVFLRRNRLIAFFVGLLLFSIVSAFPYPLFWLMHTLPIFNEFRFPPHWFFVSSFAMSALAALGYHSITTLPQRLSFLVFLKDVLNNNPKIKIALIFLLVANFILPVRTSIAQNGAPAKDLFKTPWVVEEIHKKGDTKPFRTYNTYPGDSQYWLLQNSFHPPAGILHDFNREYVQSHLYPVIWGLDSIRGFDNLVPRRYARTLAFLEKQSLAEAVGRSEIGSIENAEIRIPIGNFFLLGMMNVRYIWSVFPLPREYVGEMVEIIGKSKFKNYPIPIHLYENKRFLPRFYSPEQVTILKESEENFKTIIETPHDFGVDGFIECSECAEQDKVRQNTVSILEQNVHADSVRLKVKTQGESWLVVGNAFVPGWRASIDGIETKIYYANYIYQGIRVPEGEHEVILTYRYKYIPSI